ncbi:hypothetical protein K2Y11_03490 [bacterium]|nr:hypothetical protein [bacterium]
MSSDDMNANTPTSDQRNSTSDLFLYIFFCAVVLLLMVTLLVATFPSLLDRLKFFDLSKEIPLPKTEDIVSVTASFRADHVLFYEDIPETALPREIAIHLIDYMRPIRTLNWDDHTRKANSTGPFVKFRIMTHQSEVLEIDAYMGLGQYGLLCRVNGEECIRGGEFHYIGYLYATDQSGEHRRGEAGEGFTLRDLVEAVSLSKFDGKDRSEEIELCLLELDAASGRRPLEELDRVRKEFYDRQNK